MPTNTQPSFGLGGCVRVLSPFGCILISVGKSCRQNSFTWDLSTEKCCIFRGMYPDCLVVEMLFLLLSLGFVVELPFDWRDVLPFDLLVILFDDAPRNPLLNDQGFVYLSDTVAGVRS